jgi:hypothetical protein
MKHKNVLILKHNLSVTELRKGFRMTKLTVFKSALMSASCYVTLLCLCYVINLLCWIFLKSLTGAQRVRKVSMFYETRSVIIVFIRAWHLLYCVILCYVSHVCKINIENETKLLNKLSLLFIIFAMQAKLFCSEYSSGELSEGCRAGNDKLTCTNHNAEKYTWSLSVCTSYTQTAQICFEKSV